MRIARSVILTSFALLSISSQALSREQPQENLAERVRVAIQQGVRFLKDRESGTGQWDEISNRNANFANAGGPSSLALLALLNAGVPPDDPIIQRGLEKLRTIQPNGTYVVGLQTMVFALAGFQVDQDRIQRNVDWLLKSRLENGSWSYGKPMNKGVGGGDFSNTQYALLGLHEGIRAGARVSPNDLRAIQSLYVRTQHEDGSWSYGVGVRGRIGARQRNLGQGTMTMTTAGLCGLLITGMDLSAGKQILRNDGSAENCGVYEVQKPIANALQWIGDSFPAELDNFSIKVFGGRQYYGLYGLERAGRLTGQRFIGEHDWYRVGCEYLVKVQNANDGSWPGRDIVDSCFALLFLSKGRTPVLITKFAYGARRNEGWNNKHNDVRHLVEFASKDLFKKQPLAWQVFDVRGKEAGGIDNVRNLAAELLQSPILYFNGHDLLGWSSLDGELLKEYVANGGFVLIENCCGQARYPKFDEKIHNVLNKLFEKPLEPLAADHAVFVGKYLIPAKEFPLEGIQRGCKTVVVYSPIPLAGYWEADDHKSERGRKSFELASNIIAYATGMEMPKPRLTDVEIFRGDSEREQIRRGFLKVAQLQHGGDWHPAPNAMRNLMVEVRKTGLDVLLQTRDLAASDPNLFDYRFIYMHGRKAFTFNDAEKKNLRFLLKSGGLLFADACCGSKVFDTSFRPFMEELWTVDKLKLEPIPLNDALFGKELNGVAITTVKCRREKPNGKPESEYRDVPPALEGVKYHGRWVVIYSRYDIGCALEKHSSGDCLGHNYDSAALLGKAAVLYALKR